ncbi:hypothetical protein INS49_004361 [Diaporthe citri]|uniref:uncharacterized protein n=1 Tax=Diaporthe citri TaxID=83186 RepID=UPI001C7EF11D|nr:uncharacterized protein INS49_004361 [Diaporthe citri]KAG6354344.1 hypothetical protein INS49_004361 [Diaporthe citri]
MVDVSSLFVLSFVSSLVCAAPLLCIGNQNANFPFQPAAANASRSPCPVLNSLSNHGFLPRDGRNISQDQLNFAFTQALNIDEAVTVSLAKPTFNISTTGVAGTVNLEDMKAHNVIEHDGSLSRADEVTGNANSFNPIIWNTVKAHFTGPTIDIKTMAAAHNDRIAAATAANPNFSLTPAQVKTSFAESAFILGTLGNDFQNPQTSTVFMETIFEQERFPFGEGFQTSPTKITGDQVDGLVARLMNATSL